jgi:glycosyltransferase involved in cell wall biosynthesis
LKIIDISIIVPLYNEEAVFNQLIKRLISVINETQFSCEVILINDGSSDNTASLVEKICQEIVSLPIFTHFKLEDQKKVIKSIKNYFRYND